MDCSDTFATERSELLFSLLKPSSSTATSDDTNASTLVAEDMLSSYASATKSFFENTTAKPEALSDYRKYAAEQMDVGVSTEEHVVEVGGLGTHQPPVVTVASLHGHLATDDSIGHLVDVEGQIEVPHESLTEVEEDQLIDVSDGKLSKIRDEYLSGTEDEELNAVKDENLTEVEDKQLIDVSDEELAEFGDEHFAAVDEYLVAVSDRKLSKVREEYLSGTEEEQLIDVSDGKLSKVGDEYLSGAQDEQLIEVHDGKLFKLGDEYLIEVGNEQLIAVSDGKLFKAGDKYLAGVHDEQLIAVSDMKVFKARDKYLAGKHYEHLIAVTDGELSKVRDKYLFRAEDEQLIFVSDRKLSKSGDEYLSEAENERLIEVSDEDSAEVEDKQLIDVSDEDLRESGDEIVAKVYNEDLTIDRDGQFAFKLEVVQAPAFPLPVSKEDMLPPSESMSRETLNLVEIRSSMVRNSTDCVLKANANVSKASRPRDAVILDPPTENNLIKLMEIESPEGSARSNSSNSAEDGFIQLKMDLNGMESNASNVNLPTVSYSKPNGENLFELVFDTTEASEEISCSKDNDGNLTESNNLSWMPPSSGASACTICSHSRPSCKNSKKLLAGSFVQEVVKQLNQKHSSTKNHSEHLLDIPSVTCRNAANQSTAVATSKSRAPAMEQEPKHSLASNLTQSPAAESSQRHTTYADCLQNFESQMMSKSSTEVRHHNNSYPAYYLQKSASQMDLKHARRLGLQAPLCASLDLSLDNTSEQESSLSSCLSPKTPRACAYYGRWQEQRQPSGRRAAATRICNAVLLHVWRKRGSHIEQQQKQIDKLSGSNAKLQQQLQLYKHLFNTEKLRNEQVTNELRQSREELQLRSQAQENLRHENQRAQAVGKELQALLAQQSEEMQRLREEQSITRDMITPTLEMLNTLNEQVSSITEQAQQLEQENEQLVAQLEQQRESYTQKQAELRAELVADEAELAQALQDIKKLEVMLQQMRQRESEARDFAALEADLRARIASLESEVNKLKKSAMSSLCRSMRRVLPHQTTTLQMLCWMAFHMLPVASATVGTVNELANFSVGVNKVMAVIKR